MTQSSTVGLERLSPHIAKVTFWLAELKALERG